MQANYVQRLRFTFRKEGAARYISHLDLARALERSLNRAKIPVAYTRGFNRRPRMQFASALPLGFTSEFELADVLLRERMEPEVAMGQLMAKMAPGIVIYQTDEVPTKSPALQSVTESSVYVVTLLDDVDLATMQGRIDALLSATEVMRERRGKVYDLRPLILDLQVSESVDGAVVVRIGVLLRPGATGRPDEVLAALELDPLSVRVHRTEIVLGE